MDVLNLYFQMGLKDKGIALVRQYHYSHRPPANIQFVGTLHEKGGLLGDTGRAVAAIFFSIPPTRWKEPVLELSRLVRRDDCQIPLTRLVSLACRYLKKTRRVDLIISYADATMGHHGGIYQACSWNYSGQRDSQNDGVIIAGRFIPGRTCGSLYGTRSVSKLRKLKPRWTIEPHYDRGKHLYWRALQKTGKAKADRLGLLCLPYPKPNIPFDDVE